ncbi:DUF1552 domain-containing protein [Pseudenhygromyxa sp. WMMC2535]|uniref:DUF1552 domain-containing protein n=1 Tax=Pseudenhygromyxa sp. WMMC2535 TaxID=2712867 RepID=UPI0015543741|nr:DUF1552 domain-containing protein [Pseudenhygromyxa sp. WMMC2535]NVB39654.1 DUF1552 domain-containing protein [Pseudenhygromyxa sp. WMMC2535]
MHSTHRRHFLKLAGAGLVAAPFVNLLRTRRARAADGVAKRLIIFFSPNGIVHSHWRPTGGGSDFAFPAGGILEPLAGHQDNLIVMDGLNFFQADNHEGGMAAMLTCKGDAGSVGGGASIDQYIAAQLNSATKFKSLELGIKTSDWGGSTQTRISYSAAGQFMTPDDDPQNVYDRMFGDLLGGDEEAAKLRARRQRVVDLLNDETKSLRNELGSEERYKLDAHLEALASVEQGLQASGSCDAPIAPDAVSLSLDTSIPAIAQAQIDLAVTGLSCGLTNVASIQLSHTVSPAVFSWVDGVNEAHHSLSHIDDSNVEGVAQFAACERWSAEQFAYLLDQLAALPEPDGEGTMLDNSVVLWAKEMGDSRAHVCTDVPFVLAGGGGGYFQTGQYLSFDGEPHNKLMVSICHAMGLTNETFGEASFGTGPLEGLAS